MNAVLRKLLIVLIALVIPLQGFAALADVQCSLLMKHGGAAEASLAHDLHPQHEGRDHHGGQAQHDHAPPAAAEHHPDGGHSHEGGAHSHCGPCAACCAAAYIFGPAPSLAFPAARSEAVAFVLPPAHAINPEPLDRPPLPL